MANLPPHLEQFRKKIEKVARDRGLEFFETIFEIVPYDVINELAAYGGFPKRYPHWKFGMEYEKLSKSYSYGLSKIYEMVINTDPCYAYLMEGNSILDQKLVMAHVYGHCDFFKNNVWFSKTNRKMVDAMANHGVRISRYMDLYGQTEVENFIDKCLSLENLIDRYGFFNKKEKDQNEIIVPNFSFKAENNYMDKFLNPPDVIKKQKEDFINDKIMNMKYPKNPQKDVLEFLMLNAPLNDWQQDILSIIREEAYYFSPQGLTKTLNEGWASYWHSEILTKGGILEPSELFEYSSKNAGVLQMTPQSYNPYKVGLYLLRDIEYRWNTGRFGKDWEDCDDIKEKANWNKKTNLGHEKIFEVRKLHNDASFISQFLTEDFCVQNKLFVYKFNQSENRFEIDSSNFKAIKNQLLFMMTNFGQPIIWVENANFDNKGELLLKHLHEGQDLQPNYMDATMRNLFFLWKRPICLATKMNNEENIFRFDGTSFSNLSKK